MTKVKFSAEIRNKPVVLAEGELGKEIIEADGSYYLDPKAINKKYFRATEDDYHCPYKGTCLYQEIIDTDGNTTGLERFWIYSDPMDGWERIKGRYGFYRFDHNGIHVELLD